MFSQAIQQSWEANGVDDALAKFVGNHEAVLNDLCLEGFQDELRFAVSVCMDFNKPERSLDAIRELYKLVCDGVLQFSPLSVHRAGTCQETLVDRYAIDAGADVAFYKTLQDLAAIWATGGKADVNLSNVRAGHVPAALKLIDANAAYCRTPHRVTVYLEPWHLDIFAFLADDSPHVDKVVWVPDALMAAVEADGEWYLVDPSKAGGLSDASGGTFEEVYKRHVTTGNAGGKVMARELWSKIRSAPLQGIGFKDRINAASAVPLAGTIKGCGAGSSLSGAHNHACVVTCTVHVDKLWDAEAQAIDHALLHEAAAVAVTALDRMLDVTVAATPEARKYLDALRPLAITMSSSASDEAWETLYHGALQASTELAAVHGCYFCFRGSHASCGHLPEPVSGRWDWKPLRAKLDRHGRRHAFLLAPPVGAETSSRARAFFEHPLVIAGDPVELWKANLPCLALNDEK
jgi:ribonucleoside-diphosphate reductase subunit M1